VLGESDVAEQCHDCQGDVDGDDPERRLTEGGVSRTDGGADRRRIPAIGPEFGRTGVDIHHPDAAASPPRWVVLYRLKNVLVVQPFDLVVDAAGFAANHPTAQVSEIEDR